MTEKSVIARVLLVSRKAYYEMKSGHDIGNTVAFLDAASAILSHAFNDKKPAAKYFRTFKREIKAKNKPLYAEVRTFFKHVYAAPDFDERLAKKHIPAIIFANDLICSKLVSGQEDKAKSMCSAMASYPGFIFGEYAALSDKQFYDMVFGYYKRFYDDEFMDSMKYLFE